MTRTKEVGLRRFVSPAHKNEQFIIPGTVVQAPPNAFSGGMPIDLRRDGDVVVRFNNGILITDDPKVIEWCEARDGTVLETDLETGEATVCEPDICRDAEDPQTRAWVALVENTLNTSTKEATLPRGLDVGKVLRGEQTAVSGGSLVDQALAGR